MRHTSATDVGVHVVGRVLRNPTISETGGIRPVVCLFCFPSPLYPATRFLKRDDLCLPCLPQKGLVVLAECETLARLSGTTSVAITTAIRSVVPRAGATTIEVFSAVRHCWCPLADDRPHLILIEIGQRPRVVARRLDVLCIVL